MSTDTPAPGSTEHPFQWKIGRSDETGKWTVIGYTGKTHSFHEEAEARQFIERDKNMLAMHTKQVQEELFSGESTEDTVGATEVNGEEVGLALNRAARRRAERLAGRTPSSRRNRVTRR